MGKLESVMALAGLGVLVVVAAAVVYAVQLLGAERLNVYVMIILIILGVAVFMRGLRWIIEGSHLHQQSKTEKETVREVRILDGRLPHAAADMRQRDVEDVAHGDADTDTRAPSFRSASFLIFLE